MIARPVRRRAFVAYALVLVTATHWPALAIADHGVSRLDLYIHLGAFGTWTALCALCAWYGPVLSRRNLLATGATSLGYALVDEVTQGIPVLRRTVDPLDMAANSGGVVLALALLALFSMGKSRPTGPPGESAGSENH